MEVIQIEDRFYILAGSDRSTESARVLKQGETFAICDCHGDVRSFGMGEQGLFHEGTRHLSKMELRFAGARPLLLGSTIKKNELLTIDLMNPDFLAGDVTIRRDAVHIYRAKLIWEATCHEQLRLTNFSLGRLLIPFSLRFAADFADIFEIRGAKRERRGVQLPVQLSAASALLSYEGLDGVVRTTKIRFTPEPELLQADEASYLVVLEPKESVTIEISVACGSRENGPVTVAFQEAQRQAASSLKQLKSEYCDIGSDNPHFNLLVERSQSDLVMMTTRTEYGNYPYAGVPWFSTAFGRDGIITALETLWVNPDIARGVLSFLALTQAAALDAEKDAEPGKIIHETRKGEMAALGEIPFGCYYGSIDATPLFIALAGAYLRRTGDLEFIAGIWDNILRALDWIDVYGDADGDGFVEYARHSQQGLVQQGWKDSNDSVFHADGTLAPAPIALCEVQGYVYDAKLSAAEMAVAMGDAARADALREEAAALKLQFLEAFWCSELSCYALALDGNKRPCRVRSSNAGHCLFSGIAAPEHARALAQELISDDFFTGWGVRTLAGCETRYNPMSYHNGSIWPHDNALTAYGLARYGYTKASMAIFEGIFEASLAMELQRLPELFCGFERHGDASPILYPVACAPQAWAAGSVYLLLQGCIGLSIDARKRQVRFSQPSLPHFLNKLKISNLKVGSDCVLDVVLKRYGHDVAVSVVRKEGPVEVVIVK